MNERYTYNEAWNQVYDTEEDRLIIAGQMDVLPADTKMICDALNSYICIRMKPTLKGK
jgi:hypothetical protein